MTVAATEAYTAANLKTEIQSGPYAATFGTMVTASNWPGIANLLNSKTGSAAGPVAHVPIQASDFENLVDPTELDTLTSLHLQEYQVELTPGVINIGGSAIQSWINKVFPASNCPTTNAALTAYFTQTGSRAEVLFGTGANVSNIDVQYAMTNSGPGNSWGL